MAIMDIPPTPVRLMGFMGPSGSREVPLSGLDRGTALATDTATIGTETERGGVAAGVMEIVATGDAAEEISHVTAWGTAATFIAAVEAEAVTAAADLGTAGSLRL
ncbi:MAG TPA: hypothetical protein VFN53_01555 [Acidobacteriaceae bacterium]|nr:hypothetical protein [Acidobacteriaceae bacterium]